MKRPYEFAPLAMMLLEENKERQGVLAFPPPTMFPVPRRRTRPVMAVASRGVDGMAQRLRERAHGYLRALEE